MKLHIFDSSQELLRAMAIFFTKQAKYYIKHQGQFNVVLSGGNSPKGVYQILASPEFKNKIDWEKVCFFFGDERYVPANDLQNNALMVENSLFKPLQISDEQAFKIDTTLPPTESAGSYFQTITSHFQGKPIHFDLILLGLGDDAHTASLFPYTEVLEEQVPTVCAVNLKPGNTYRITMTAPLINQAKHIVFLVFGNNKAAAVRQVIKDKQNPLEFPALLIKPLNGELHWFMDKAAATLLN